MQRLHKLRLRPTLFAVGAAVAALAIPVVAHAQKTLRVAFTESDIPITTGNPDQGQAGMQMVGFNLYDALVNWDLSRGDRVAPLKPGLATAWSFDPADPLKWTFKLRQDVKFHDGSTFDADAVVWNFEKLLNDKAAHFDKAQSTQARGRITSVKGYRKIDAYTVEITTHQPDSFLPYQLAWVLFSSPTQYDKLGQSWDKFAFEPSGTGPWKIVRLQPRERLEMQRNPDYWDKARVPKLDRMVVTPMPEPSARVAALRSGQVDWIEGTPPDAIANLKQAGFQIVSNAYPHAWIWHFSTAEDSPAKDLRVRQAANLAVDRAGLVELLGGYAEPAKGIVPPGSPWFGKPKLDVRYDPDTARKLLAEAGYSSAKPAKIKLLAAANGSGQMLPVPMNEFIQSTFAPLGIELQIEVADWGNVLGRWRNGPKADANKGFGAINLNVNTQDPFNGILRFADGRLMPPKGVNFSEFADPAVDALIDQSRTAPTVAEQDALLGQIHARIVDEALFLFVVHDVAPRAISAKIKGYVQPQSWYMDFTQMTIE